VGSTKKLEKFIYKKRILLFICDEMRLVLIEKIKEIKKREKKVMENKTIKIKDLAPNKRRLNLVVRVLELGEKKDIVSRATGEMHRILETLVGDETGTVKLTLWDDKVNSFEEGKTYEITNANTTVYQGSLRLNVGKYSEVKLAENEIPEEQVNRENNISDKEIRISRPRGGYGRGPYRRY